MREAVTLASQKLGLHAGEVVEVRSAGEILATLGPDGRLDGLPFMPEMLQFSGKQFRVSARAHKSCDTIHHTGCRSMTDAVHLDLMVVTTIVLEELQGRIAAGMGHDLPVPFYRMVNGQFIHSDLA